MAKVFGEAIKPQGRRFGGTQWSTPCSTRNINSGIRSKVFCNGRFLPLLVLFVGLASLAITSNFDTVMVPSFSVVAARPSLAGQVDHEPFGRQGGIILFLHVPKTGGMTMRNYLRRNTDTWMGAINRPRWKQRCKIMDQLVGQNSTHGKTVTFELHAPHNPSYWEESAKIHEWRKVAHQNGIPFFAFTVLREPLEFALSYFTFFVVQEKEKQVQTLPLSEKNFRQSALVSPQCLFLLGGTDAYETNNTHSQVLRQNMSRSDCDGVYRQMLKDFDWIGTTETLNTETIPILNFILGIETRGIESFKINAARGAKLDASNLTDATVEYIHNITKWDRELYNRAVVDYSFERHWKPRIAAGKKG